MRPASGFVGTDTSGYLGTEKDSPKFLFGKSLAAYRGDAGGNECSDGPSRHATSVALSQPDGQAALRLSHRRATDDR